MRDLVSRDERTAGVLACDGPDVIVPDVDHDDALAGHALETVSYTPPWTEARDLDLHIWYATDDMDDVRKAFATFEFDSHQNELANHRLETSKNQLHHHRHNHSLRLAFPSPS